MDALEKVAEENVADAFGKDADKIEEEETTDNKDEVCDTDDDTGVELGKDSAEVVLEEDPAEIVLVGPEELIDEEEVDRNVLLALLELSPELEDETVEKLLSPVALTTALEEEADAESTEADDVAKDERDIAPEAELGEPDPQGPDVDLEGLLSPLCVEEGVVLAREKEDETWNEEEAGEDERPSAVLVGVADETPDAQELREVRIETSDAALPGVSHGCPSECERNIVGTRAWARREPGGSPGASNG